VEGGGVAPAGASPPEPPQPSVVEIGGVRISCWEQGAGFPLLLLHETAASAEVWRQLADALEGRMRTIAFDRRGWGGSEAPPAYARTTIEEQARDATELLARLDASGALVCGAGLGAVVALELLLRNPALVRGAVLVEPPLLAFVPEATEGLSADRIAIEEALRAGGPAAALDLYLAGGLPSLGPGAERIPESASAPARGTPLTLFAELAAVPDWPIPSAAPAASDAPVLVAVGPDTPPHLRRAAEALAGHLDGARVLELGGAGLPHVGGAVDLAAALGELAPRT
jgi:pimeloyl-ACP methyl ester carboxylesterase